MMNFRYREKDTAMHNLNPVCKMAWVVSVSVVALILNHPIFLVFLFLSTMPLVITARVWREWATSMKYTLYLCLMVVGINVLVSYHGSHVLWQAPFQIPVIGVPVITLEALFFGIGMSLRLLTIISAFTILTLTIHPDSIMQALLKIKIPYKSILVISLSTRFVPTLIDDAKVISDIQRSRGLELDQGNLIQKIKRRSAVIIPLLSNSLDRTVQVAEAMEARAFGFGKKRVFYQELNLNRLDILMLLFSFFPVLVGVLMRFWNMGDYQYYPTLGTIVPVGYEWLALILLLVLFIVILPLAVIKKRLEYD
jgi:energy-coupling factor transport system permease protein